MRKYLYVCLFVYCASALAENSTFYYTKSNKIEENSRIDEEGCLMCYGNDCISMPHARCQYHMEAAGLLDEDTDEQSDINEELRVQVDTLLFDITEKVKAHADDYQCVPLVSRYTSCTKDNFCTGCSQCQCDLRGKWNCSAVQQCRNDNANMNISYRVLQTVMQNIKNDEVPNRVKRSNIDTQKSEDNLNKISNDDIHKSMYEMKPNVLDDRVSVTTIANKVNDNVTGQESTTKLNTTAKFTISKIDNGYLAFDEVLSNIGFDTKTKRKQLDVKHNETIINYMDLDDENINNTVNNYSIPNALYIPSLVNTENVTRIPKEDVTKVIIDLLETIKNNNQTMADHFPKDYMEDNEENKEEYFDLEDNSNKIELNTERIIKRDISIVTNNVTVNSNSASNVSGSVLDLKNNVLKPLFVIINEKQKELEELFKIKAKLTEYIKNIETDDNLLPNIFDNKIKDSTDSYFSIYKIERLPQAKLNTRRTYYSVLERFLYKLKQDIYEVMKDIAGVRKFSPLPLSKDLKVLLRAMKYYIHNQGYIRMQKQSNKYSPHVNGISQSKFRRNFESEIIEVNNIKDTVINIFDVINKDMPNSNALSPLSHDTKKILKRIIKQYYVDEFAVVGLRVSDPHYNLTNDLRGVGIKWQKMTTDIVNSAPADKLYNMKLLHLVLCKDMKKMADALALIDFAHSRRIMPIEHDVAEEIMLKINKDLQEVNEKITEIVANNNYNKSKYNQLLNNLIDQKHLKNNKKESFLKKIKNMLLNSKNDLLALIKGKVPKSNLVKHLAQKKLDELNEKKLSEYQETMRKWQKNLNIVRSKRSVREYKKNQNRIKNIIPNYLRGKVNPAIKAKDKKKLKNRSTKANSTGHYRKQISVTTVKTKTTKITKITKSTNKRNLKKMKRKH